MLQEFIFKFPTETTNVRVLADEGGEFDETE